MAFGRAASSFPILNQYSSSAAIPRYTEDAMSKPRNYEIAITKSGDHTHVSVRADDGIQIAPGDMVSIIIDKGRAALVVNGAVRRISEHAGLLHSDLQGLTDE